MTAPKLDLLRSHVQRLPDAVVCFSGGIDSTLVLAVAHEQLGSRALGVTAISPSVAANERSDAQRIAATIGVAHEFVATHEMDRAEYVQNGTDRCYHCKTELYAVVRRFAAQRGFATVLNGTNRDDLGDYRPGLHAATEARIQSPLVELEFTKQDVRTAALALGLDTWDKPASACLASRLPYGTSVTLERLQQVAGLEAFLRASGFRQVRVRYHDTLARIEVPVEVLPRLVEPAFSTQLLKAGRAAGFTYVTVDIAGYRQGSHNEMLQRRLPLV
jgi:pyridinium-3,5-biscarboxylic acid mononucleotide sulfurtransferase